MIQFGVACPKKKQKKQQRMRVCGIQAAASTQHVWIGTFITELKAV